MLLLIRSLPLSFALNLVPRMLEMAFQSFLRFQNFLGEHTQDRPRLRGMTAPCLYSRLLFSNQLPTSNFIETPENPNKFKNVRNMYNFAQNRSLRFSNYSSLWQCGITQHMVNYRSVKLYKATDNL